MQLLMIYNSFRCNLFISQKQLKSNQNVTFQSVYVWICLVQFKRSFERIFLLIKKKKNIKLNFKYPI